jgi:hypothetical protein
MGKFLPMLTCLMAPGVYDIPEVQAGFRVVVTNATPIAAYRGAGRPEAAATIERAVDLFAAEIGMDPAEVRRRNFIAPDQFPFQTKTGALYDSGDYAEALDKVLTAADYEELRRSRNAGATAATSGSSASAWPPTWRSPRPTAAAGETAKLEVHGRRHRDRLHRQLAARPGAPHRLGHARAGGARHPDGQGHRHPRRHRPDPGRRRHLRLPLAAARRLGRAQGRGRGQGRGAAARPRTCSRRPRPTSCSTPDRPVAGARRPGHGAVLGPGRRATPAAAASSPT